MNEFRIFKVSADSERRSKEFLPQHAAFFGLSRLSAVVLQGDIPNYLLLPTPTLFASLFSQHSPWLYCGEIFQATLLRPTPLQGTEVTKAKVAASQEGRLCTVGWR